MSWGQNYFVSTDWQEILPPKMTKNLPFFTNMLPEGANRRGICRSLRIDENDFFGLLIAMADKDFIGAVQVRKTTDD